MKRFMLHPSLLGGGGLSANVDDQIGSRIEFSQPMETLAPDVRFSTCIPERLGDASRFHTEQPRHNSRGTGIAILGPLVAATARMLPGFRRDSRRMVMSVRKGASVSEFQEFDKSLNDRTHEQIPKCAITVLKCAIAVLMRAFNVCEDAKWLTKDVLVRV